MREHRAKIGAAAALRIDRHDVARFETLDVLHPGVAYDHVDALGLTLVECGLHFSLEVLDEAAGAPAAVESGYEPAHAFAVQAWQDEATRQMPAVRRGEA